MFLLPSPPQPTLINQDPTLPCPIRPAPGTLAQDTWAGCCLEAQERQWVLTGEQQAQTAEEDHKDGSGHCPGPVPGQEIHRAAIDREGIQGKHSGPDLCSLNCDLVYHPKGRQEVSLHRPFIHCQHVCGGPSTHPEPGPEAKGGWEQAFGAPPTRGAPGNSRLHGSRSVCLGWQAFREHRES